MKEFADVEWQRARRTQLGASHETPRGSGGVLLEAPIVHGITIPR